MLTKIRRDKLKQNLDHFGVMRYKLQDEAIRKIQKYAQLVTLPRLAMQKNMKLHNQ